MEMSSNRFLDGDIAELKARGIITEEELKNMIDNDDMNTCRNLIEEKLKKELAENVSIALTKQPTDQILHSDIIAAAAGGFLGAASAWFKTTPILNPNIQQENNNKSSSTHLWNTAKESALRSMETSRKIRTVDYMEIEYVSGDLLNAQHIVIAINGFMTHGYKASLNWETIGQQRNVVCYVLLWEAGNPSEWDSFCNETTNHFGTDQHDILASHFTVGNPWNKAQNKAQQVGIILGDLIISKPILFRERNITLVGHSLGSCVIHSTMKHISKYNSTLKNSFVSLHQTIFFAGAFVPDHDFSILTDTVFQKGIMYPPILNVFSTQDHILMHVFSLINMHIQHPAAGCSPIDSKYVRNVDVTDLVPSNDSTLLGHSYERYMNDIIKRLGILLNLPELKKN